MSASYLSPCVLFYLLLFAGDVSAQNTTAEPAPAILLPANVNSFSQTLTVSTPNEPTHEDFTAGPLLSADSPDLQIAPSVDIQKPTKSGSEWQVAMSFTGRIPFGNSTLPVYFQGHKMATLHLVKSGLAVDRFAEVQSEDQSLLLVLRNPSAASYDSVRARLRFGDSDVCGFSVEHFPNQRVDAAAVSGRDCNDVTSWTSFILPQYTGISLRTTPAHAWFVDTGTGLSHRGKQKGLLTLRFFNAQDRGSRAIDEQNIPLETEFQAGLASRTRTYLLVGFWLLVGAIASVLLRVAIPNYRRFRSLREDLLEIRKLTRGITEEVDSSLRVQLRVERLALDTLRKSASVISPGFSAIAQRVETGVAVLKRRIGYVRRLDASLNRRRLLIANELAPPTRIDAIERYLDQASEELKSDQFREEDWVFIEQALNAADKALTDPTEQDKSAFETSLVQRWKNISGHFQFVPGRGWTLPPDIEGMGNCFPSAQSLPQPGDDGTKWIDEIGIVRADLQITALELIREFEFLAPASLTDHWNAAMLNLNTWLATPAPENIAQARTLLRQLAEGIDASKLITALQGGEAQIELDPQSVGSGERVRLAVRFRRSNLNSAAARSEIICEWRIRAVGEVLQSGTPETTPVSATSATASPSVLPSPVSFDASARPPEIAMGDDTSSRPFYYREKGWDIYHYFENFLESCPLEVRFYFDGKPVLIPGSQNDPLVYRYVINLQTENAARKKLARKDWWRRVFFEALELCAVLLVPLCALAIATADQNTTGYWWQLIGLGFGSDTIRNVLAGAPDGPVTKTA